MRAEKRKQELKAPARRRPPARSPRACPGIRVSAAQCAPALAGLEASERLALRQVAGQLTDLMMAWARRGQSAVSLALGCGSAQEWQQYPGPLRSETRASPRFFYHCHPQAETPRGEHGHFHVFVDSAADRRAVPAAYSHLVAIAVDDRGLPLRLFTTNRWVTGERWRDMDELLRLHRRRPPLSGDDALRQLWSWIDALLRLFAPQLQLLLRRRELRTAQWPDSRFEDRRRYVLSDCRVSLPEQLALAVP